MQDLDLILKDLYHIKKQYFQNIQFQTIELFLLFLILNTEI